MMLLAVPNVSEGRDPEVVAAIGAAFERAGARLLDTHVDPDHNRSVFTLAAPPGRLAPALAAGGAEAVRRIDMRRHAGAHPCVGSLDVAPVVHLDRGRRGAACVEALVAADELARQVGLSVFLYGPLAGGRTRAQLRQGGLTGLLGRVAEGELGPDFGPPLPDPRAGATLVAARPPLVAFNLELEPSAGLEQARQAAAAVREGGPQGLPGLRAIGVWLASRERAQVSCNVEDPAATPLRRVVEAISARVPVAGAELVGLAPEGALEGFPPDVPLVGFEPERQVIERVLDG